jgi:hypothetical protein
MLEGFRMENLEKIREEFPITKNKVFLNHAAHSPFQSQSQTPSESTSMNLQISGLHQANGTMAENPFSRNLSVQNLKK